MAVPSERAALIAAIQAAPDDDAVRLVCADWFEEQGDEASVARADFIRTQVRRAGLPPDAPEGAELEARELRLLRRYAPAWCGAHFAFQKVRFRRGFIEAIHLHLQHFLHHRRQLFALEPVRDVRLTGWYRAPADLVRRVAGCEEWRHVETLRIHHQGPHKDPRGEVVLLLESPHLTRLRALHLPRVAFDVEARRRFERLPVLSQVKELSLPALDTLQHSPGGWLSDDGAEHAAQWGELRSLRLPYFLSIGELQHLTEMPFWGRLTALGYVLQYHQAAPEGLSLLRDRMPTALRELRLHTPFAPFDYSAVPSFFDRVAQVPLRSLTLIGGDVAPTALSRLLDTGSRCELEELYLSGCRLNSNHARALAESPRTRNLRSLTITGDWGFDEGAAELLFSSGSLQSLAHLNVSVTRTGPRGGAALAAASGMQRLRSLDVCDAGLDRAALKALLGSPNLRQLAWLTLGDSGARGEPALDFTPDLAAAMTRLPHLACVRLGLGHCDPRSQQILAESGSVAWPLIDELDWDSPDEQVYRSFRAPDRCPPLDAALDRRPGWL
jgi:uncharacterized protein (TIGR02996 family)